MNQAMSKLDIWKNKLGKQRILYLLNYSLPILRKCRNESCIYYAISNCYINYIYKLTCKVCPVKGCLQVKYTLLRVKYTFKVFIYLIVIWKTSQFIYYSFLKQVDLAYVY